MKFVGITKTELSREELEADYASATRLGRYAAGARALYCPKFRRRVYIPYADIVWAYRRQETAEGKLCCGKMQFAIHKILLYTRERQRFELAGMEQEQAKAILAALEQSGADIDIGYSKEKEAAWQAQK